MLEEVIESNVGVLHVKLVNDSMNPSMPSCSDRVYKYDIYLSICISSYLYMNDVGGGGGLPIPIPIPDSSLLRLLMRYGWEKEQQSVLATPAFIYQL